MSIYVGNLSYEVTQDDLNSVFCRIWFCKQVHLPTDRETGRACFGFVEMSTDAEEDAAIEGLDGAEWMGRALKVNKASLAKIEVRHHLVGVGETTASLAATKLTEFCTPVCRKT